VTGKARHYPEREFVLWAWSLPQEEQAATTVRQIVEKVLAEEELTVLGWRVVPVQPNILGVQARENQPQIEQVLVAPFRKRGMNLSGM